MSDYSTPPLRYATIQMIATDEAENAWNGVRFANASLTIGRQVKIFPMNAGVEREHHP